MSSCAPRRSWRAHRPTMPSPAAFRRTTMRRINELPMPQLAMPAYDGQPRPAVSDGLHPSSLPHTHAAPLRSSFSPSWLPSHAPFQRDSRAVTVCRPWPMCQMRSRRARLLGLPDSLVAGRPPDHDRSTSTPIASPHLTHRHKILPTRDSRQKHDGRVRCPCQGVHDRGGRKGAAELLIASASARRGPAATRVLTVPLPFLSPPPSTRPCLSAVTYALAAV
jgi:hypothetical protein